MDIFCNWIASWVEMAFETFDEQDADINPEEILVRELVDELNGDMVRVQTVDKIEAKKILKLATALYKYGIGMNNLLSGDMELDESEGDEEEQEEEEEEEEEDDGIDNHNDNMVESGKDNPPMDGKYYQFGHEEEEELLEEDDDYVSGDGKETNEITRFDRFITGNPFENSLELLDLVKQFIKYDVEQKLTLSDTYDLMGNNHLELENFKDSVSSFEKSIKLLEAHYKADPTNEEITEAYMKLCEALKWAQDNDNYKKYLEITIRLIQQRLSDNKSQDQKQDEKTLEELKEDMQDINESNMDIREKHPAFDNILKRALGQLLDPDAIASEVGSSINDLSSMIKKKKSKK